jgi:hypothetical protein
MKYIQTYDPDVYCGDRFKALDLSLQLAEPELLEKYLYKPLFVIAINMKNSKNG